MLEGWNQIDSLVLLLDDVLSQKSLRWNINILELFRPFYRWYDGYARHDALAAHAFFVLPAVVSPASMKTLWHKLSCNQIAGCLQRYVVVFDTVALIKQLPELENRLIIKELKFETITTLPHNYFHLWLSVLIQVVFWVNEPLWGPRPPAGTRKWPKSFPHPGKWERRRWIRSFR